MRMYPFKKGEDLFYCLGWFQLYFSGKYCKKSGKITLYGRFVLHDVYDWQNPGRKYITLMGAKTYDKYATLVEDHNLAKPFKIIGTVEKYKDTYDLNAKVDDDGKRDTQ